MKSSSAAHYLRHHGHIDSIVKIEFTPISSTIDSLVLVAQAIAESARVELGDKFRGISAIMREAKALGWSKNQERQLAATCNRCAEEFWRREEASFIPYEQSQMDHVPGNPTQTS